MVDTRVLGPPRRCTFKALVSTVNTSLLRNLANAVHFLHICRATTPLLHQASNFILGPDSGRLGI